jgi:DNA-binding NtrC family response regulator
MILANPMRMLRVAAPASASIYVVDDAPFLTELYARLLEPSGYTVTSFNDRVDALAALNADWNKPDLLITDYLGPSMPVDQFLHQCLVIHPALRILMISGLSRAHIHFSQAKPDRFIQKPFGRDELQREVEAILARK